MYLACSITFAMEFVAERWGEGTLFNLESTHFVLMWTVYAWYFCLMMYFINVACSNLLLTFSQCIFCNSLFFPQGRPRWDVKVTWNSLPKYIVCGRHQRFETHMYLIVYSFVVCSILNACGTLYMSLFLKHFLNLLLFKQGVVYDFWKPCYMWHLSSRDCIVYHLHCLVLSVTSVQFHLDFM